MKYIYQNFKEIAEDFKRGEHLSHKLSDHSPECCYIWQESIMEFAKALDGAGIKLPKDEKVYNKLWKNISNHFEKWEKGYSKSMRWDYDEVKEITLDEAKKIFPHDKNLEIGKYYHYPTCGERVITLNGFYTLTYKII